MSLLEPYPGTPTYCKPPKKPLERHETLVDMFGRVIFALRNGSINSARLFVGSAEAREKIGALRAESYERVAAIPEEHREAALVLAQETMDGFIEGYFGSALSEKKSLTGIH